ncbi:MAG: hypothetical protein FRX48_01676 [Lasallia pustulata]|uniref:Uncharacterized protein n=1 Tax=Lasallia pustulata TaxID=136370 RepID=A0A5M8Q0N2_9LECA|nr:MAG: hypothetical protein FRX48_01676 [Lasallia pustulata]
MSPFWPFAQGGVLRYATCYISFAAVSQHRAAITLSSSALERLDVSEGSLRGNDLYALKKQKLVTWGTRKCRMFYSSSSCNKGSRLNELL